MPGIYSTMSGVVVHAQCENRLSKKSVVGRSRSAKNRACFKELENRGNITKRRGEPYRIKR